jgi:glutaredoxin
MGYTNYQALKEQIDNAIDGLKNSTINPFVKINTRFGSNGKGYINIVDNGSGMTRKTLHEAFKLGSRTGKVRNSTLGFFGFGMKGSAISMGRGFRIITKHSDDKHITGYFDLDDAIKLHSWKFARIVESSEEDIEHFKDLTNNSHTGTIIEIYKLDKISNRNKTQFDNGLINDIAMTYRYFITGNDDVKKIKIMVNGRLIEAIDPMGKTLPGTVLLNDKKEEQKYQFNVHGTIAEIIVRYYHVDSAIDDLHPSLNITPRNNSFYVMRNRRQIMESTKLGFRGLSKMSSDHSSFRAELLFDGKFDEVMCTNIMKTLIVPPQSLYDQMQKDVTLFASRSKTIRKATYPDPVNVDKEIQEETQRIIKEMNESKNTPTIVIDKNGVPLKKTNINIPIEEPKVEPTSEIKRNRKKETEPREKKEYDKVEVGFVNFGEDSSFFVSEYRGNGKFRIGINADHFAYNEYARLDRQGRKYICALLHSFTLAAGQEIQNDETDELVHTWSNFLRRELKPKE